MTWPQNIGMAQNHLVLISSCIPILTFTLRPHSVVLVAIAQEVPGILLSIHPVDLQMLLASYETGSTSEPLLYV